MGSIEPSEAEVDKVEEDEVEVVVEVVVEVEVELAASAAELEARTMVADAAAASASSLLSCNSSESFDESLSSLSSSSGIFLAFCSAFCADCLLKASSSASDTADGGRRAPGRFSTLFDLRCSLNSFSKGAFAPFAKGAHGQDIIFRLEVVVVDDFCWGCDRTCFFGCRVVLALAEAGSRSSLRGPLALLPLAFGLGLGFMALAVALPLPKALRPFCGAPTRLFGAIAIGSMDDGWIVTVNQWKFQT